MPPLLSSVRRLAKRIIRQCGITNPPVDLHPIVKHLGLPYLEVDDLPSDIEAVIYYDSHDNGILTAFVNKNLPKSNCRFSLAHQLAHCVLDHYSFVMEGRVLPIDIDPNASERIHYPPENPKLKQAISRLTEEERADEFALELLIPSFMLQELFSAEFIAPEAKAARIANEFKVSIDVAQVAITPKEERYILRVPPTLS